MPNKLRSLTGVNIGFLDRLKVLSGRIGNAIMEPRWAVLSVCFSSLRACQTQRMLAWVAKGNDNIECQLETRRSQNQADRNDICVSDAGWASLVQQPGPRSLRTKP
jgi:hypothetical protein